MTPSRQTRLPLDDDPLDDLIARLASRNDAWVQTGIPARIELLRSAIEGILEVAEPWVREACGRRGIDPDSAGSGEEWIAGPMTTVRNLQLLVTALEHNGSPRPVSSAAGHDGRVVAQVFPRNLLDRFLFYNMTAEVWIEPGQPSSQGQVYREKQAGNPGKGRLALVLGAGNVSSIAPLDVAYKLFVEDQVVVMKMNPVNDYLAPFIERAFKALIDGGFLGVVCGDMEVGDRLCRHPQVDTIHLTGSERTYEAIVWGPDPDERRRRKAEGRPVVDKPFTAELGCVTPVIVVPGRWSRSQLEFQARHVAAMVAHNASFNCTAAKVLITAKGWPQRDAFVQKVRAALAAVPARQAYYPGAHERYRAFVDHYPDATALAPAGDDAVPWTWIPDVAANGSEYALRNEAFCGVLADVQLDATGAPQFLERAVDFCNDEVEGTLSCVLLVDGPTQSEHGDHVERALMKLRYGNIGVNAWTGVNFGIGVTAWGAFPGNPPESIGSGTGVVHNAFLFDHPQKSIVRAPFKLWPKPVWFADHSNLHVLGRRMTHFEAHPNAMNLLRVALAGARG